MNLFKIAVPVIGIIASCVTVFSNSFNEYSSIKSYESQILCQLQTLTIQSVKEKRVIESVASHECWRGTTKAKVTCPVWINYGIDLRDLQTEDIKVEGRSITIYVSKVKVLSVDTVLEEMKEDVNVGWLRCYSRSGKTQKNIALANIRQKAIEVANQEEYILSASQRTAFAIGEKLRSLFPGYHFEIKFNHSALEGQRLINYWK